MLHLLNFTRVIIKTSKTFAGGGGGFQAEKKNPFFFLLWLYITGELLVI